MKDTFKNIDDYILLFPITVQGKLIELRKAIHSQVPDLEEYIGYQMPAFKHKGKPLVYFAGYKKHIGFYPGAEGIKNFEKEFEERNYKFSKGAVQFPIEEDIPLDLIQKIVTFRITEIEQKKS
ncbi:iron chaperone [Chryseobacterium sp. MYb328]|uniref:iron chaperone n=1 Tax=Chryseobacterium sp. MYb328 TaxID=2745231 RepID=UPI003099017C